MVGRVTPELRTERLVLSPYVRADEEDFVSLFQTAAFGEHFGDGMQSPEQDRALFARIFSYVYAEERFPVWAVRLDGAYAGHAEIKPSPAPWLDGHEIVYGLAPRHQHRGLGTEVAAALTAYGHETLGLAEVHATVDSHNAPSLALLERLGYARRREVKEDDGHVTCLLTSTAEGWAARG
ncbi:MULTISPECIES: GNAT family N-acetyltransferase [Streptomyces]|uniref:GNAT family N-acetyltransferase n=1 Tax=Streptomyces evansiae TaxID=3075535 RepID=A0ABD5E2W8_9ACTN|nr:MULTISPECIES: GNAT family N-acetyltransferase [unclassified Streptomyces]ASY32181.1 GNAT family N-acetyltransferase [Streptomyces sp. CLI2509]MDT0414645.1 GNAT family N-acetyltransferase [Streptomyces sp. DSM 41982]MYX22831.1 GNAT family N-acetyltransferase [Streptomyces sp. SID8380]SCD84548.1 Protein N-acetyltransferase, RimJ/RimL family [Streptomyces sp. SolWspMP-sol7th]